MVTNMDSFLKENFRTPQTTDNLCWTFGVESEDTKFPVFCRLAMLCGFNETTANILEICEI